MDLSVTPLEKHADDRGWVSEVYSGELDAELQNIHLGTMEPGAVRGNHLHREGREWIIFFDGPVEFRWQQGSGSVHNQIIDTPSEIVLPPNHAHGFRNPDDSGKTICFAAYRDQRYREDNPDVEPAELF